MSRRTSRTRAVFSNWPVARWKRRLNCSFFSLSTSSSIWSIVIVLMSAAFMSRLLADPLDETGLDRQLRGGERQRLFGDLHRNAVDLEQDASRLHPRHPEFRRAFARTHAHFERLLRHRHVRKHADPDPAGTFHVPGQRAARRLDLARGDALRLHRLEPELAERQVDRARGDAVDAALMGFAEFGAYRLQHCLKPLSIPCAHAASRRGRPASPSAIFLSCAIGSCSMISPLKIQTLTPQVP